MFQWLNYKGPDACLLMKRMSLQLMVGKIVKAVLESPPGYRIAFDRLSALKDLQRHESCPKESNASAAVVVTVIFANCTYMLIKLRTSCLGISMAKSHSDLLLLMSLL